MNGTPDHSRAAVKPFLLEKEGDGAFRLTVRDTRYNGQGYPIVTATRLDEVFPTATAARAHAQAQFGARAGQFATK